MFVQARNMAVDGMPLDPYLGALQCKGAGVLDATGRPAHVASCFNMAFAAANWDTGGSPWQHPMQSVSAGR